MPFSVQMIKKLDNLDPEMKDALLSFMGEIETQTRLFTVDRSDFLELKDVVTSLAAAQVRTEQRMGELSAAQVRTEQRMEELSAAQTRTEQRIEELSAAQTRTEQRIEELSAAQTRTEQRMEELSAAQTRLTAAQDRTEQRLEELSAAQVRTEKALSGLARDFRDHRKQFGGLTMDIGYGLEDKVIPHIKAFARSVFNIDVSVVDRRNVIYPDGSYDEVNLYAEGVLDGKKVFLIGEGKAQPGKKDFVAFAKKLDRLKKHLRHDIQAFLVGYQYTPSVEDYAAQNHPQIKRYKTFELMAYN